MPTSRASSSYLTFLLEGSDGEPAPVLAPVREGGRAVPVLRAVASVFDTLPPVALPLLSLVEILSLNLPLSSLSSYARFELERGRGSAAGGVVAVEAVSDATPEAGAEADAEDRDGGDERALASAARVCKPGDRPCGLGGCCW